MVVPTRPSSAPSSRRRRGRSEEGLSSREARSFEGVRDEVLELKRLLNEASCKLLQSQAARLRLEKQNAAQAKQIESLLSSGAGDGSIRRQHDRSLITKRLREQLEALRSQLRERDATVAALRRSHRHSIVLELQVAKDEYFKEAARLKRALLCGAANAPQEVAVSGPTTKAAPRHNNTLAAPRGQQRHRKPHPADDQDALRLFYQQAKDAAIRTVLDGGDDHHSSPRSPQHQHNDSTSLLDYSKDTDLHVSPPRSDEGFDLALDLLGDSPPRRQPEKPNAAADHLIAASPRDDDDNYEDDFASEHDTGANGNVV